MGSPPPQDRSRPVVLVVDDEERLRQLTRRTLELAGYAVREAADGIQALALLVQQGPVDLVVTDLRMPVMDGWTLADELARQWPRLPILFISGYDAHTGDMLSLPGPVLPKPFSHEQLTAEVQRLLGRRQQSA